MLHIVPEHLPITSSALMEAKTVMSAGLAASARDAVPIPPGLDAVSRAAAAIVAGYAAEFFPTSALGGEHLSSGAQQLVPTSIDYRTTDTLGGGRVAPLNAGFLD